MFEQIKKWAMQPTTVHGFGAIALAVATKIAGGAPMWVTIGAAVYGLVLMAAPDNSVLAKSVEKFATDAVQAAAMGKLKERMPDLFGDGAAVLSAVMAPAPAPVQSPAPVVQLAPAPAPQPGQPA